MARKICTIILALAIGFFGVIVLTSSNETTAADPAALSEVSYTALKKGTVYYVEDLIMVDSYAEMEDGSVLYFLTIFTDANGNDVAMTMPLNKDNPLWTDVNAYLYNDSMYVGDYTVDCYVKVESNYTSDDDLYAFFNEYVTDLRTGGYVLRSDSSLRLSYVCGADEDPAEAEAGAATVGKIVGIVCIALAVLMMVLALKGSGKPKAAKAQPAPQPQYRPQAPVAPAAPAGSEDDVMVKLQQYQKIHAAGLMTDEEYEAKRRQLLGL